MSNTSLTRRRLLQTAGALPLALGGLAHGAEVPAEARPRNAAEALEWLKAGNRRFVEGKVRHVHEGAEWRKHLVLTQRPFAILPGCADSRVPPELVFDQGFGDLFVIRVAGNVIDTDVAGSIQYAIRHLKATLVVVMGHEGCGAVAATLEVLDGTAREPKYIEALAKRIEPGLKGFDPALRGDARLSAAVEANARWSVGQLARSPEGRKALEDKVVALVGAVYDLKTGRVRFLA
jgi:carbonic anhydrase